HSSVDECSDSVGARARCARLVPAVGGTSATSPRSLHDALPILSRRIMNKEGVDTEFIRFVDHDVAPGIYPDMTEYGWGKDEWPEDRKSTRLNSSHVKTSYAVFCLKKKRKITKNAR